MIYGSKIFNVVDQLAGISAESSTGTGFLPGLIDAVPLPAFGALTGPFAQQGSAIFTLIAVFSLGHILGVCAAENNPTAKLSQWSIFPLFFVK